MSFEQMNLFGGTDKDKEQAERPAMPLIVHEVDRSLREPAIRAPILPGVKAEEAYPQINSLEELRALALNCCQCRLRAGCRQVVFGVGPADAGLMLVGEGPGEDEDRQGEPFVGRAGQLLDKILAAAELDRQAVYIGNVVKCRPPGNRLPGPDEVRICRNYLEAQIRIIRPQILVCLGSMASKTIIDPQASISRIRGQWFTRAGVKIIATFHPAALLRNEEYKRPVWEDFKKIRDEYRKLGQSE